MGTFGGIGGGASQSSMLARMDDGKAKGANHFEETTK